MENLIAWAPAIGLGISFILGFWLGHSGFSGIATDLSSIKTDVATLKNYIFHNSTSTVTPIVPVTATPVV